MAEKFHGGAVAQVELTFELWYVSEEEEEKHVFPVCLCFSARVGSCQVNKLCGASERFEHGP